MSDDLIYDNVKLILDGRQESAVRRFTSCIDVWGILLLHKVGTGKTITSLLIALNTYKKKQIASSIDNPLEIIIIAPIGIYDGFIDDLTKYILFFRDYDEQGDLRSDIKTNGGENKVFKFFDVYFKLINYNFDKLIYDLNKKKVPIYDNKIIIIDEAHRLLTNDIYNSTEAAGAMKKHSLIEDILFKDSISKALRVITMSGTPMQQSPADLCKFGNFLTKSNKFSSSEYAAKIADLVWVTFMIKQIELIKTFTSFFASLAYSAYVPGAIAAVSTLSLASLAPIFVTTLAIGGLTAGVNFGLTSLVKSKIATNLARNDITISRGGKKTKKNLRKKYYFIKKNKTVKKYSNIQHGGDGSNMVATLVATTLNSLGTNFVEFVKSKIPPTTKLIETAITSTGVGTDSVLSELAIFSPFSSESKDILNVIDEPVFNIKYLAKSLSPIISIYDYELQNTINLICLKQINEILNKIMNTSSNPIDYNTLSKNKINFTREQSINCLIEINKIKQVNSEAKISEIMINNPKCDMELVPSLGPLSNINTRFPDKITELKVLFFDDVQKNFIRKFCLNLLTDKEKAIFYLNKYEKISLDYKEKLLFFVNNMKFISNFSEDVINYYSYLDQSIKDPSKKYNKYVYKKRDENDTTIPENKPDIFKCKKFEDALSLIKQINTGKMPIIKDGEINIINHPHGKDDTDTVKQDDELLTGYYLPVVYSYTEDFGLGLFANFLESQGHKYILINKLQENIGEGNSNGKDLLEQNKTAGFLKTYSGTADEPICVLIDPTMTEGLNAKFNPAILILEACNTFGDSEQVEGRVLRKYGLSYKSQKKKVIYQYLTNCDNIIDKGLENYLKPYKDRYYILKDTLTEQKRIGNAFSFTVREYNQASSAFKYISPDSVCYDKIKREKNNLQKFEKNINFGIANADLKETVECEMISNTPKVEEFLINFNPNPANKSEDLFYDCKTLENKNKILEIQEKIAAYPEPVQLDIAKKLKDMIEKASNDYKKAYDKLLTIFKAKYKKTSPGSPENSENLKYNYFLDELFIRTFTTYINGKDEFMVVYFISTHLDLFNTDQIISSAQTSTLRNVISSASSLITRQTSEEYFTAQESPFNRYIENRFKELEAKELEAKELEAKGANKIAVNKGKEQIKNQEKKLRRVERARVAEEKARVAEEKARVAEEKARKQQAAAVKRDQEESEAKQKLDASRAAATRSQKPTLTTGVPVIAKKIFNPVTQTANVPFGGVIQLSDGKNYDIEMAKQLKEFITKNGNSQNMFRQQLSNKDIERLNSFITNLKGGKKTRKNKVVKINRTQTRKYKI